MEKKFNGGYGRLKAKYAKLMEQLASSDAEIAEMQKTIESQSRKISQLSADLHNSQVELYEKGQECAALVERGHFLFKHCPFWVRWMYEKRFLHGK